jgi:GT2 family glycosyltransferase
LSSLVRHPLHTWRATVSYLRQRSPIDEAARTWQRLWFERHPLTDLVPSELVIGGEPQRGAPSILPNVRLAGERHRGIVLRAPGRIAYRTRTPGRGELRVWCALMPGSWRDAAGATITVSAAGLGATPVERRISLAPGRRWGDRRWVPLVLPVADAVEVAVTAEGDGGGPVEIVIGDPEVRWARSPAEVRALMRAFAARVRRGGLKDTWRWAQETARRDEDAARYRQWCARHTPDRRTLDEMRRRAEALTVQPRFSIVTPCYNTAGEWLDACFESVRAQAYPRWELIVGNDGSTRDDTLAVLRKHEGDPRITVVWNDSNRGISAATQSALDRATGDYVCLLDSDDVLMPHALYRVAEAIEDRPDADILYTDEDKLELDGARSDVYFKPDWAPDLFLSSMYVCHFLVLRRSVAVAAGGFRSEYDGSQDYDLMLRAMDLTTRIQHVPDVVYHWRKIPQSTSSSGAAKPWAHIAGQRALQDYADRNHLDAVVDETGWHGLYRMRYRLRARPRVSVVVPVGSGGEAGAPPDLAERTGRLMASLRAATYRDFEVVLVGASLTATHKLATEVGVRVVEANGPPGAVLNAGARAASGAVLLFADSSIEPLDADWIEALLEHTQRADVGAAGGKSFYPDGRLRHMGLVMVAGGLAARPFDGYAGTWGGYFSNANCVRNCSAVSRACVMTRREVFEDVGGWDEGYRGDILDVDFGLRLRERGLRVVWTPYARVVEHVAFAVEPAPPDPAETARMRAHWGAAIDRDPYYNPHFVESSGDYRVRVD